MANSETRQKRVAIVTGGARGIGMAVAQRLNLDGLDVAVIDRDIDAAEAASNAISSKTAKAVPVRADVSSDDDCRAAVQSVVEALGPPTVLVNNAGIIRDNLLHKLNVADWDTVLDVHLRGAYLMSRAVQNHMVNAGWGRIVNMSSASALGNRGQANYSAAKAGLQGFTKTLAIELGKFGITANSVAPGFIETDMNRAVADRLGIDFEEYKLQRAQAIPVGRVGQPTDVAAAVSFFVSEDSGFTNGQVLYVAGGPRG